MKKTNKNSRAQDFANIKNIQELEYNKRLLTSRIDQQEIMIMYKLKCVWEFISPANLLDMGCKAIASHNPSFNVFYKTFQYVKSLVKSRKK